MEPAGLPWVNVDGLVLRPATSPGDVAPLAPLLAHGSVTEWWGMDPAGDLAEELETVVLIEVDGELAGVLQCHEESYEQYPQVAFDIALGPAWQGRGIGPRAIEAAMRHYAAGGHHRFVIDPAATNRPAIAAYERAGFQTVGVLRSYERAPSGQWRDGVMMEALAWEVPGVRASYRGPVPEA